MLDNFATNVFNFNEIAGNNLDTSLASFEAQQKCLVEEVQEISEGIANKNLEEVLDGVVDTMYVAIGMLHKLKEMGIDVEEAMRRIGENNLSKYPEVSDHVIDSTVDLYDKKGVKISYSFARSPMDDYKVVVFKDENGKIRKSYGFESVTLKDLVVGIKFDAD